MFENAYDARNPQPGVAHVMCNGHDKMKGDPTMPTMTVLWDEAGK